jgi:hypothetical protein
MPVVAVERFDQVVEKYYVTTDEKVHTPIYEFLEHSGLRRGMEGFINKMLMSMAKDATKNAVINRTLVVTFTINTAKAAQHFQSRLPEKFQQQVSIEMLMMAIELLLEEQSFLIENHTLTYTREILPEEEVVPQPSLPPAAEPRHSPQLPTALLTPVLLAPTAVPAAVPAVPAVTPATPAPAAAPAPTVVPPAVPAAVKVEDELNEEDLDLEPEKLEAEGTDEEEDAIAPGMVFGNGRGIQREIQSIESGRVSYMTIQGKGNVKAGSGGECSYKSFLGWAKEKIS